MKKIVLVLVLVMLLVGCAPESTNDCGNTVSSTEQIITIEKDYIAWDLDWGGNVYRIFDEEYNNICYIMDNDSSDDLVCFDLGEN